MLQHWFTLSKPDQFMQELGKVAAGLKVTCALLQLRLSDSDHLVGAGVMSRTRRTLSTADWTGPLTHLPCFFWAHHASRNVCLAFGGKDEPGTGGSV